jgi:hypothetical protein
MEFITFEIAKKLKEKGFREKCLLHYESTGGFYSNSINTYDKPNQELDYSDFLKCFNEGNSIGLIDAPTTSQVLAWFRKEHHLHFEIVSAAFGYDLIIADTPDKGGTYRYLAYINDDGSNNAGAWDKYEDCVIYGIEYVLNNLI